MRILLALDDSEFSAAVTDTVIAQIKTKGVEVRLLHAIEPFPARLASKMGSPESPDFVAARVAERASAKKLLARAGQKLRWAGFKVTASVEEGDARDTILEKSEAWQADLIILGSHGQKGFLHYLMGSVTEAVVRHARCSVQIVRIRKSNK